MRGLVVGGWKTPGNSACAQGLRTSAKRATSVQSESVCIRRGGTRDKTLTNPHNSPPITRINIYCSLVCQVLC